MRVSASLALAGLLLASCAHPGSETYDSGDVGRTIDTIEASVVSSREVKISGEAGKVGAASGGALGAAGSALLFQGSGLVAVIGAVIGAGAGYLAEQSLNDRDGVEYILKMDDGRTVTIVQNREDEEPPLEEGTPVLVQVSGQYTRVLADPRAERVNGGSWLDPDTAPVPPDAAAGGGPTQLDPTIGSAGPGGGSGDPDPTTPIVPGGDQQ